MRKQLVTAVITTHNRSNLLERAIKSVLEQTYSPMEIIVVDDASTDDTKEVCKKYDINYVYIPAGESKGGNYARNQGVNIAKGEYIAFLDDDDYWLPEKISKQIEKINATKTDIVFCARIYQTISKYGVQESVQKSKIENIEDLKNKIMYSMPCTSSQILLKKHFLLEIGLFDEELKFWQDYELLIRTAQRSMFSYVDEPLVVYTNNTLDVKRLTNKYFDWKKTVIYIYNKHKDLYKRLNKDEIEKYNIMVLRDAFRRTLNAGLHFRHALFGLIIHYIDFVRRVKRIPEKVKRIVKNVYAKKKV